MRGSHRKCINKIPLDFESRMPFDTAVRAQERGWLTASACQYVGVVCSAHISVIELFSRCPLSLVGSYCLVNSWSICQWWTFGLHRHCCAVICGASHKCTSLAQSLSWQIGTTNGTCTLLSLYIAVRWLSIACLFNPAHVYEQQWRYRPKPFLFLCTQRATKTHSHTCCLWLPQM